MTRDIFPPTVTGSASEIWKTHVQSFMADLKASGYAACKFRDKRRIILHFVGWMQTMQIPTSEMNEVYTSEYLKSVGGPSKERFAFKRALLRGFLRHLRKKGVIPKPPKVLIENTPAKQLEQEYADYLRDERGLSFNSLLVYMPFVRSFLADCVSKGGGVPPCDLTAEVIRAFMLHRVRDRSSEYARLLSVALRSFLHFLFLRGRTPLNFSLAITMVRKSRGAAVHAFLTPAEVEQVLSTPDVTTATGRRDYAILLLLARLGLRAGEVVALELDDISWHTGEIVVRGKGCVYDRLPLLKDVGEALALYLESDRKPSDCRQVFLRSIAPRVGLSGPAAIGHVVRQAIARAGLQRPCGVAAHLLRHSLATNMLQHGASLQEISEVLRHRSMATTEIYAKVAFENLREVARPWPGGEVVR